VFGYPEASLKEIGMYHMMKESAVEKAKSRAVEKLREAYPGSRLQVWRTVHRMLRRPVPPPENNVGLARHNSTEKEEQLLFIRRNFPIRPKYKNENLTWLMSRKELQ